MSPEGAADGNCRQRDVGAAQAVEQRGVVAGAARHTVGQQDDVAVARVGVFDAVECLRQGRENIGATISGQWAQPILQRRRAEPEHRRERPAPADAIVAGLGRIDGRKVCVLAVDATVLAGTTAPVNMRKQNRLARWAARRSRAPSRSLTAI